MFENRPVWRMDGTGNQFLIVDAREHALSLSTEQVKLLSETYTLDQLIVLEESAEADIFMRIYNADGGEVDACGNASRCVGWLIGEEKSAPEVSIHTKAGFLKASIVGDHSVRVDMGAPKVEWNEIPVAEACDTLAMPVSEGPYENPVGVSMGNPHAVFFIEDVDTVEINNEGKTLESHPFFPERVNVGFAETIDRTHIKLRVYERGVGETQACGTGACAAAVAGMRKHVLDRTVTVSLPGGDLTIEWPNNEASVLMTGSVSKAEALEAA